MSLSAKNLYKHSVEAMLTKGGLIAALSVVVLAAIFTVFYRAENIDAWQKRQRETKILAALDRKIHAAEAAHLTAAAGLEDQKQKILQSVASAKSYSDGYHPYLLPENRIYVDRLRKAQPKHTLAKTLDTIAKPLQAMSVAILNRDADRWFLFGLLCSAVAILDAAYIVFRMQHKNK